MRRVYWLLGVSSVSGVLAAGAVACSSDSTSPTAADDGGTDAPADTSRPKVDAGDEDAGPTVCPTTDPIKSDDIENALGPWKGPGAVASDCTQEDIDAIKALFADAGTNGVKFADIKAAVDGGCGDCMFTTKSASRWGMYVEVDAGAYFDNKLASCFAESKDETCGKERFEWQYCIRAACTQKDCVTDTAVKTCYAAASEGACKTITDAYVAACPNEKALIDGCSSIYQVMVATCGGGPDAGLDAASN